MEGGSEVFDELTEIDALIGNVVEDGFVTVALIFHVANLHLETQSLGNLATLNHSGMLAALGFLILLHIYGTCYAIDTLDVIGGLQVCLLQLQLHQTSCQRDNTDVVTRVGLYRHDVALLQVKLVDIVVIALSRVFELHFHEVGGIDISWHVSQPVVGVELSVLTSHGVLAESTVAASYDGLFFFHIVLYTFMSLLSFRCHEP